ncbi:MAG: hypothetical protein H0V44_05235 [Planctomycetes bacterium]|nr:hypothetical protein [Planctomycetota bacterium]
MPTTIRTTVIAAILVIASASAHAAEPKPMPPSANKGKTGSYQCQTKQKGCTYYVSVPASYGDDNPAGIHLFFHGNGGHNSAAVFEQWDKHVLKPHNLIGINMEFEDDDNRKDTSAKSAAAREAVAQTLADYKIIPGRGVVASFEAGGITHAMFAQECGRGRGPGWPFCHSALYTSAYPASPAGLPAMSWFIGCGSVAWLMALDRIGADSVAHAIELSQNVPRGGCPDICLKITKGQDNLVSVTDIAASTEGFARADLAFAPFIYAPDFAEKDLKAIVASANDLQLGAASASLTKLAAKPGLAEEIKAKADQLSAKISERIGRISVLAKDLAKRDPVLCNFYVPLFVTQCKGLPSEKELKDILAATKKDKSFAAGLAASAELNKMLPNVLMIDDKYPKVPAQKIPALTAVAGRLTEGSQAATLAAELILLKE